MLVETVPLIADLIASLWVWAEPDKVVTAELAEDIDPARLLSIAFLCTWAEPLNPDTDELISDVNPDLIASLLISAEEDKELIPELNADDWAESRAALCMWAEPDKLVMLDALELTAPCKEDLIASLWEWAEPDKLVTLDSIAVWRVLEEVTYPAKAVSFSVSTLLIKVTISANVSVSATEAESIASILPFSVPILPSNDDSIALRCVWADPLNTPSAAM